MVYLRKDGETESEWFARMDDERYAAASPSLSTHKPSLPCPILGAEKFANTQAGSTSSELPDDRTNSHEPSTSSVQYLKDQLALAALNSVRASIRHDLEIEALQEKVRDLLVDKKKLKSEVQALRQQLESFEADYKSDVYSDCAVKKLLLEGPQAASLRAMSADTHEAIHRAYQLTRGGLEGGEEACILNGWKRAGTQHDYALPDEPKKRKLGDGH